MSPSEILKNHLEESGMMLCSLAGIILKTHHIKKKLRDLVDDGELDEFSRSLDGTYLVLKEKENSNENGDGECKFDSASAFLESRWTTKSCISIKECAALQKFSTGDKDETMFTTHIPVHIQPYQLLSLLAKDGNLCSFCSNHSNAFQEKVMREIQKGIAFKNKELIYNNLPLIEELRKKIGYSSNSDLLLNVSRHYNVPTTELGIILSGKLALKKVIDGSIEDDESDKLCVNFSEVGPSDGGMKKVSDVTNKNEEKEDTLLENIALQTIKLAKQDRIAGHKCKTNQNQTEGSKFNFAHMETFAKTGEIKLIRDLKAASEFSSLTFQTEQDQISAKISTCQTATPDILLEQPLKIHGRSINWIDAKNVFILPGISSEAEVQKLRSQALKYIAIFGPGCFYWSNSKYGVCEGFLDDIEGLLHVTPIDEGEYKSNLNKTPIKCDVTASQSKRKQYFSSRENDASIQEEGIHTSKKHGSFNTSSYLKSKCDSPVKTKAKSILQRSLVESFNSVEDDDGGRGTTAGVISGDDVTKYHHGEQRYKLESRVMAQSWKKKENVPKRNVFSSLENRQMSSTVSPSGYVAPKKISRLRESWSKRREQKTGSYADQTIERNWDSVRLQQLDLS